MIAFAGFGGDGRIGPLGWTGKAEVFKHPTIQATACSPARCATTARSTMRVDIGKVRVLAADGDDGRRRRRVFLQTFGKILWSAGRGPQQVPDTELLRTGRIALLSPGEEVPLTVAWHDKDGKPKRVDYGEGSLAIPG